jgi:hypothetical protein
MEVWIYFSIQKFCRGAEIGTLSADSTAEKNLQQSKEFWISGLSESKVNLSHFLE